MKVILRSLVPINSSLRTLASALTVVLFHFQGFAQQDTTRKLDEVQVRASVIPVVKTITPSQTIGLSDFKRYSANNVADAIRNFSGVNIKDYGGIGGLKTVSVRSLGANHTGVQYDGVQISDSQNGQVDLGKINLDNVQSITLYNGQPGEIVLPARSFATASLLVINSRIPDLKASRPYKVDVGFRTGSFGLINPTVQWHQRINPSWSLNLTSSYQQAHGKYKYKVDGDGSDTLATRNNADISTVQTDASLFWIPDDSTKLNIRANFVNSDRGLPGAVIFYNPYTNQQLRNRDEFIQSSYSKKWNKIRLLLNGKLSGNYTRYLDPDYLNTAGVLDQRYTQQEFYTSGTFSYKPLSNLEVAYASDFAQTSLKTNLYNYSYPTRNTYLNALSSRLNLGGFELQGTILNTTIVESVSTGVAAADRNVWSPSFLLSYQPRKWSNILVRAFYKDIFRNPTFNDLYYTRIGNRTLKPEFAEQYNVGVTYSTPGNSRWSYLTLATDIYYNRVRDKIIAIPNKDLFTWSMVNLGEVDIRGIDLGTKTGVNLTSSATLLLSVNYTFQQALDVTQRGTSVYLNQIPYTPEHTLSVNGGLNFNNWGVFYNHIYSSGRYYMSENQPEYLVPGFGVGDLSVNYNHTRWKYPMSATLELNNVFNTSYAFIRSFPMPGRSARISFQITI